MKKILIITNAFPPYKYVGRLRVIQTAKYLPKFGWKPIVLAPTPNYLWVKDIKTLNEIPKHLKVYRAFMPIGLPVLVKKLSDSFAKNKHSELNKKNEGLKTNKKSLNESFFKHIFINFINTIHNLSVKYLYIPDYHIIWLPFMLFKSIRIIENKNIDMIYSCSPANSMHIFGFILKILTKKSWIADYRDLWSDDHLHLWKNKYRANVEKYIEKNILRKSDKIIVTSKPAARFMLYNFKHITFSKIHVITNGYDSECNLVNKKYIKKINFSLVYTGNIMKYSKSNLLMAIGQLLNQYRELKNNLRVFFIGNIDYEEKTEMENTIISFAMQKNFIFKDWVNYKKLLKIQRSADLLLLIKGSKRNTEVVIPGKIFEYIISGRPILALVPDGAARDLIMETNTGICVYPNDVEGIKNAILALYHKWENNQLKIEPNYEAIKKYDRKNLTKKLAAILDETLNKK